MGSYSQTKTKLSLYNHALIFSPIKLFFHCRIKSIIKVSIFKGILDIILYIWTLAWKSRYIAIIHFARNHTNSSLLNTPDRSLKNTYYVQNTKKIVRKNNLIYRFRVSFWWILRLILPPFIPFLILGSFHTSRTCQMVTRDTRIFLYLFFLKKSWSKLICCLFLQLLFNLKQWQKPTKVTV